MALIGKNPALWMLRRTVVIPNPMRPRGAGFARLLMNHFPFSPSARDPAFKLVQMLPGFVRAFVDVRRDVALRERIAQLRAQKAAGGVAGDPGIEAIDEAL